MVRARCKLLVDVFTLQLAGQWGLLLIACGGGRLLGLMALSACREDAAILTKLGV